MELDAEDETENRTVGSGDGNRGAELPAHRRDSMFQDVTGKQKVGTACMKTRNLLGFPRAPHTHPPHPWRSSAEWTEAVCPHLISPQRQAAPPEPTPLAHPLALSCIHSTPAERTLWVHDHTHSPGAWHSAWGTSRHCTEGALDGHEQLSCRRGRVRDTNPKTIPFKEAMTAEYKN